MSFEPYRALYLHVPFCVRKCAYCDFSSQAVAQTSPLIDGFIERMVLDIRKASREGLLGSLETVYLGGGTPSHIGLSRLSQLLYTLSLSMHLTPEVECTMEANPESLDARMVRDVWALGVNRLSIGVQSFDDDVLHILGRPHDADAARKAVCCAHERFENVSIDLMCGIPGQSDEAFEASVLEAVSLGVAHMSIYPLTIEEGTPFAHMVDGGSMPEPDDDTAARHMSLAADILKVAGFQRYEVASYAKPGFESRHNSAYWQGVPYLGLGKDAVSMRQNAHVRERVQDGEVIERLDAVQMLAEDLMLGMRMARGVSAKDVEVASFALDGCQDTFDELVNLGFVELSDGRFRPTNAGWLCGNEIYGRILALAP